MGITHKIAQCNIFKCVMNASQNPIQILGYQISLNKSPTLSSSSFEDLRGPVCRAGFTTPCRHLSTQRRSQLMARWRGKEGEQGSNDNDINIDIFICKLTFNYFQDSEEAEMKQKYDKSSLFNMN